IMEQLNVNSNGENVPGHALEPIIMPPSPPTPTGSGILRPMTPCDRSDVYAMRPNITLMASQKNPGWNTSQHPPTPTGGERRKLTRGKSIKLDYMDQLDHIDTGSVDELWGKNLFLDISSSSVRAPGGSALCDKNMLKCANMVKSLFI
ncbi:unnamed protein product, partial [Oppiella nova]